MSKESEAKKMNATLAKYRNNISLIKDKKLKAEMFRQMKAEQRKQKKEKSKRKKEEAKLLGEKAPAKEIPKTIENQRVPDETFVKDDDEEVAADEAGDEISSYFKRETTPKILLTTSDRCTGRTSKFIRALRCCIPSSHIFKRRHWDLKKLITKAVENDFTDLIVINEDRAIPNGLLISHLPDGPTAHFKISNVKLPKEIKNRTKPNRHLPEIVLNNFRTRLGHSIGRLLASLFPHNPEFHGRRVITFHNQRDFIFFRQHRYQFRNEKRVGLQEMGPRFTMKLRSLQKGTFNSKYGEYEWIHKRHEMESNRRRFCL